ncbi:hypothetical protein BT93_E2413 [Corymbia citriodora subsp. variegata]|nr:hypothetical protein BT93_E2413 [Corymbia citriodora subsp. variegata]
MAPKRPLPAVDPPPASSSEDESAGSSEDEEHKEEEEARESGESEAESESDDEDDEEAEEQKKPAQPKSSSKPAQPKSSSDPPSPPPPPQPQQQQQKSPGGSSAAAGSESESESGSESGTESESDSRRYTVKPIASKPMEKIETPPPGKKQRVEPSSSSKQPSAKRKTESEDSTAKPKVELEDSKEAKDSKKGRKKKDVGENGSAQKPGEESKKPMFQRIWGDGDELALLQGMIDFREKRGMDPFANANAFHHYVKKSLGQEFSDSQLANKIRVLKKKYSNNEGKGKDGEDRAFSKPHEQKVFELSKKIWGASKNGDVGGSGEQTPVSKANGTAKKSKAAAAAGKIVPAAKLKMDTPLERPKENGQLMPSDPGSMLSCDKMFQISGISLDQDFLKEGWEMVDKSTKEELKERWRKVHAAEMRVLAERATLIRDQTNIFLEAYERADGK